MLRREVLPPRAREPDCVRHEDRSPPWVARCAVVLLVLLVLATGIAALAVKLGEVDAERERNQQILRELGRAP